MYKFYPGRVKVNDHVVSVVLNFIYPYPLKSWKNIYKENDNY